ncbi:hypothetical protein [Streptomyces sp. NPDC097610]|uniref:hypothetical protein n=1 Tax=Streptomyces sp. NPDC097610 TaxID=3157227 RepID=UPI003330DDCC
MIFSKRGIMADGVIHLAFHHDFSDYVACGKLDHGAAEDASRRFGFLAAAVLLDNPTSSVLTQKLLGWRPEHPALVPDLEAGHYFDD